MASIVVGSALLLAAHAGPHREGLPVLGLAGFAVACALALKSGKL